MNPNLLFEKVEYEVEKTDWGVWRRHLSPTGQLYSEFTSHGAFAGWPLLHYTYGRNPETGRRKVAKGVVAIGRFAVGGLAIGQVSAGIVAVGQLALGLLLGLGQGCTGAFAVGQVAIALLLGLGQIATGYVAVGQVALGMWVLAQVGVGGHAWTPSGADPEAQAFFREVWGRLTGG